MQNNKTKQQKKNQHELKSEVLSNTFKYKLACQLSNIQFRQYLAFFYFIFLSVWKVHELDNKFWS